MKYSNKLFNSIDALFESNADIVKDVKKDHDARVKALKESVEKKRKAKLIESQRAAARKIRKDRRLKEADENTFKYSYSINDIKKYLDEKKAEDIAELGVPKQDFDKALNNIIKGVDHIESTDPIKNIPQPSGASHYGWDKGTVVVCPTDGKKYTWTQGDEDELPLIIACVRTLPTEVREGEDTCPECHKKPCQCEQSKDVCKECGKNPCECKEAEKSTKNKKCKKVLKEAEDIEKNLMNQFKAIIDSTTGVENVTDVVYEPYALNGEYFIAFDYDDERYVLGLGTSEIEECDKTLNEIETRAGNKLIQYCENYGDDIVWKETLKSLLKYVPEDIVNTFIEYELNGLQEECKNCPKEECDKSLAEGNHGTFWDSNFKKGDKIESDGAGEVEIIDLYKDADYIIIKRNTKFEPFVAAWAPELSDGKLVWGQGHYCDSREDAEKCVENKLKEAENRQVNIRFTEACKKRK